jgi:hypothetical protein
MRDTPPPLPSVRRLRLRTLTHAAALASALALCGCGPTQSATEGVFEQLKQSIAKAENDLQDDVALEQAHRILGTKPDPTTELWARGKALQKAAALNKANLLAPHIDAIDPNLTLASPDQYKQDPALREAHEQVAAGLHDAYVLLFQGGKPKPTDVSTLNRIGALFQARLPDSLFLSEILFYEAERVLLDGRPFEAALLYEEMKRKDFQGKHDKAASERVEAIWADALRIDPLKQGKLPPERPLQEPFTTWLADAQAKLDAADPKQRRALKARIATIQLAFGLTADAFSTLESIARDAPSPADPAALDALTQRVRLSLNLEGADGFPTWRASLAPDQWPELWHAEPWRRLMLEVAALKLPLGGAHIDDAYALLSDIITAHDDEVSIDAAIALLTHASTALKPMEFRKLRKPLQERKFLWSSGRFRGFVNEIKKRVEGG